MKGNLILTTPKSVFFSIQVESIVSDSSRDWVEWLLLAIFQSLMLLWDLNIVFLKCQIVLANFLLSSKLHVKNWINIHAPQFVYLPCYYGITSHVTIETQVI